MTNSKRCSSCQVSSAANVDTTRHLDHLIDIQNGTPFTAIPNSLMKAFIDGFIPESKFKLISIMLTHSDNFKIRRAYLENRFSKHTLKKYLGELEQDGYIRRDKAAMPNGATEIIYHTNRIALWKIPDHKCTSSRSAVEHGAVEHGAVEHPLNKKKGKEKKQTKKMDGWVERGKGDLDSDKPEEDVRQKPTSQIKSDYIDWMQRLENHCHKQAFFNYRAHNDWFKEQCGIFGFAQMKDFVEWFERRYRKGEVALTMRNRLKTHEIWVRENEIQPKHKTAQN